tara:strand:+ start:63 stop:407 length:345 start_codon:yes stop_codon:yes gene_type:complete
MGESKQSIEDIVEDAIHYNEKKLRQMGGKLKAKLSNSGCVTTRERAADDVAFKDYERRRRAEEKRKTMAYRNDLANKDSDDDESLTGGPATKEDEDLLRRVEKAERERKKRLRF